VEASLEDRKGLELKFESELELKLTPVENMLEFTVNCNKRQQRE
jgi:hypothetical protein